MRIKLGFLGLSIPVAIERARNIISKMTGNLNFPAPNPSLADGTTSIDAAEVAYNNAKDGGKVLKTIMRLRFNEMLDIFRKLGAYVQSTSGGDEEIILSSGFDVVRRGEPIIVGQVKNLQTTDGPNVGSIHAYWDRLRGASAYIVEISETGLGDTSFRQYLVVVRARLDLNGLVPGKAYWIRVIGVGSSGYGLPSDPSIHLAVPNY